MKNLKIFTILLVVTLFASSFAFYKLNDNIDSERNIQIQAVTERAPEIKGEKWINIDKPLTLESLKGKVVLIEFWTFECYNCKNTLPKLKSWYDKYKSDKFEMIGIHCPEFDSERNFDNVKQAVSDLGIKYPVATDNAFYNWYNYNVDAWPTIFVIDKNGDIRYKHVGEGSYKETQKTIEDLMKEAG